MVTVPRLNDEVWDALQKVLPVRFASDPKRNNLSISKVNSWIMCGESYRRTYIDVETRPNYPAAAWGSAAHKGFEVSNRHIQEHKTLPKVSDVVDAGVTKFNELTTENGETPFHLFDTDKGSEKDELAEAMKVYCSDPGGAPLHLHKEIYAIEGNFRVLLAPDGLVVQEEEVLRRIKDRDLEGFIPMVGYIDLIEGDSGGPELIDYKTTARSIGQDAVDTSAQLTVYSSITDVNRVRLDVMLRGRKLKKGVVPPGWGKDHPLRSTRKPEHMAFLSSKIWQVAEQITKGNFPPFGYWSKLSGGWKCSPKYCEFYYSCIGAAENGWNIKV